MAPTLILTPRHTPDAQALWRAALLRGWEIERLARWEIPPYLKRKGIEPVLYAEALFGATLAADLGVNILEPDADWLCKLGSFYTKRRITLSTHGEASQSSVPIFVKTPNEKGFPPGVYARGVPGYREIPGSYDSDTVVLVSEPVHFTSEYRCFVLDGRVRTTSLYTWARAPMPDPPMLAEPWRFVVEMLRACADTLPRACVVDVGFITDRGWAIVEANSACGAGIYDCDPDAVLDVVQAATVPL